MDRQDRLVVVSAIVYHDESTGGATDVRGNLGRMMMCRKASELLGVTFRLMVKGNKAL